MLIISCLVRKSITYSYFLVKKKEGNKLSYLEKLLHNFGYVNIK